MQKYNITTFGCQMNVHDSEQIAGVMEYLNYTQTDNIEEADVVIFNTCCIRDTAEQRALGHIGSIKHLKKKNPNLILIVAGCMTQQEGYSKKLKESFPYVDIIIGTSATNSLIELVPKHLKEKKTQININKDAKPKIIENEKFARSSFPNAWVNITYGCDNFCTYCIVPYVRGRERSRTIEDIVSEVKEMLKKGYKEITLLGQNVNSYGKDLADGSSFSKLLREIDDIDTQDKFRVRFMTSHPKDFSDDIIDIIANSKNICKYIHLPIQSGSNKVLKDMNRKYTREEYLQIIDKIRAKIPHCGITTDIMVGFPYEDENDFNDTLDIVKRVRFLSAFMFIYSKREGTAAAKYEQIPYRVKSDRIQRLIKLQNKITLELSKEYANKVVEVLCEDTVKGKDNKVCGRTDDGKLVVFDGNGDMIGKFFNVLIKTCKSASLIGEVVYDN